MAGYMQGDERETNKQRKKQKTVTKNILTSKTMTQNRKRGKEFSRQTKFTGVHHH